MRKAIALIELIFAIVVMAITLLAVPNLIATTTKASNNAITQEAVSNAASYIDMTMSQFWDENSTNPKYNNPILVVQGGHVELDETTDTTGNLLGRRVGSAKTTSRRFAVDDNGTKLTATPPANLGKEELATENPDDVDDFNGTSATLVVSGVTQRADLGDYIDQKIDINTTVTYINDIYILPPKTFNKNVIFFADPFDYPSTTQSTNIKYIQVILGSDNDKTKQVVLKAFSCNIGSSRLKEKKF